MLGTEEYWGREYQERIKLLRKAHLGEDAS